MKDPYYQKILAGLERLDNPSAFEECARNLLRDAFPSLAAVHGGSDAGMDGAIADGEGEAYPLVSTTAKDVRRNLKKNLASYVRSGKKRRRAVLATSRAITPPKRRRLEAIAREEYGFTLVNIYDQRDFAERLYRDSRWTRELLGITGEPPALSAVPRTRRPFPGIELVARDDDLQWLRETRGHRLVVGQPGSGKTALLLQLVQEGSALFLATADETRIAEACRDLQPALILVDDAHLDPEKLVRLRQIRAEIGADFEIVASSWPGAEDEVADALGISSGSIRRLELLTRAEIVQVLRSMGVSEPDDDPLLRQLVDLSANKPGLAVTLGSLWLRGEMADVLTGKAIRRSLIPALKRVMEQDPTELLACFALGGTRGLSLETVGKFLELGREEIYRRANRASQGGVLHEHWDHHLEVQPEALRSALIAEVFFTSPSLPFRPLLDLAPERGEVIETLSMAALRGADVPRGDLRELLLEEGSRRAWQAFALLGESEALWVLESFPGNIAEVAPQLLEKAPRPTIQRLLHEAECAEGPLHTRPPHPLRLLEDWVQDIPDPHQVDEVRRRRVQVQEAKAYLQQGGDRTVGLRACFLALSPRLESTRWVATGGAITSRQGSLSISSVPQILKLWAKVRDDLGELTPESWAELGRTLRGWLRPNIREPTEEKSNRYLDVARQIVSDLADQAQKRPGLLMALKEWANRLELPFDHPEDEEFAVLFPLTDHIGPESWREEEEKQSQAARELAERWASRRPQEVSRQLARYAEEARGFRGIGTWANWAFFRALADVVDSPHEWLSAFLEERLPAKWLGPVLERVLREQYADWKRTLEILLDSEDYAWLAAELVIRSEGIAEELIDAALSRLPAKLISIACQNQRVPLNTLRLLLEDERGEIAGAAAAGEWLSEPRGEVRPQILAEWRRAVLRQGSAGGVDRLPRASTFGLREILASDSDLAAAWLEARIEGVVGDELVESDGVYAAAIEPLPTGRREELLPQLPPTGFSGRLIPLLIGDSTQLYQSLLAQDRLREYHLTPLAGRPPDGVWAELAGLALEAGHEPRAIAKVAFARTGAVRGFPIEHWRKWETAFRGLMETAPEDVQKVAQCGLEIAELKISEAKKWKRRFEETGDILSMG